MPKATTPRSTSRRHNPLADDLLSSGHLRTQSSKRKSRGKNSGQEDDDETGGSNFIDAKASRKILQIGQDLAEEEAAERRAELGEGSEPVNKAFDFSSRFDEDDQGSDDEDKFGEDQWGDEEEVVEEAVCWGFLFLVA